MPAILSAVTVLAASYLVYVFAIQDRPAAELSSRDVIGLLALNEWGDFFAALFASLAFIWIVASVIIQGAELKDQRTEMARQADALSQQARHIETELARAKSDAAWRDILEILDYLKALVPMAGDPDKEIQFRTFHVGRQKVIVQYDPDRKERDKKIDDRPASTRLKEDAAAMENHTANLRKSDDLPTILFLGRAAGGLRYPIKQIEDGLDSGLKVECPRAIVNFRLMKALVNDAQSLVPSLPLHKKTLIEPCRLGDWSRLLDVIDRAYDL